ncbi:MAG: putative Na+/H+ antiporter [Verrucomicrobiales bacterium]
MARSTYLSFLILLLVSFFSPSSAVASGGNPPPKAWPEHGQFSHFPVPVKEYEKVDGLGATLSSRIKRDPFNLVASIIFLCAILHTFAAGFFNRWAHRVEAEHRKKVEAREALLPAGERHPEARAEVSFKATMLHFLGEVEAIFGLWVIALAIAAIGFYSWHDFTNYVQYDRAFVEPIFVVIIMAIASSRPVLRFAESVVQIAARLGKGSLAAWWVSILTITPILGSFITEPAAITIGALLLAKKFYRYKPGTVFAYATIGLLFVNVSVGGALTHFAAPPVLMVASTWNWTTPFMLANFGWKTVIAILASNILYYAFFAKELRRMADATDGCEDGVLHAAAWTDREDPIPHWITAVHILALLWTVINVHTPVLFIGGFLFFLAFVFATEHHQNSIRLRGPILVGFFLAGLIIHGGCQSWWIEPIIQNLEANWLMLGATILTAFNDNAAITYLAAQVPDISAASKLAVVAGAVTGGGLTVIANAPNPAGQSILARFFKGGVSPLGLALGAIVPTIFCYMAFTLLPNFKEVPPSAKQHAEKKPAAVAPATTPGTETNAPAVH